MGVKDLAHGATALFTDAVVQPLSLFFLDMTRNDWVVVVSLLAGAVAFGFTLGRARAFHTTVFQNRSEALVTRLILKHFTPPDYHLMSHVTLQMHDGTTQVDQILVSRFGVFVIETKDYKGWIFGNAQQRYWTQVIFRAKFRFQNPVHQNMRHVRAVQDLLHFLPRGVIKSVVVFTGDAEFKTDIPQGVFRISELVEYLHNQTSAIVSHEHVQLCVGRLEMARLAISGETDVEHVQSLQRRHGA